MLTRLKTIDFLKETAPFAELDETFLMRFSTYASDAYYSKGKLLFVNGDPAQSFYVVKSGRIKLFRQTPDGNIAITHILPSGHIFGETALFEDNAYSYSAEAIEDSCVLSIPLADLKREIEQTPALALAMLDLMSKRQRRQDCEIEHKTLQSASQRIGCFLLQIIPENTKGATTVRLPYDKTLLAARLGMQPETFSRALSKLKTATGLQVKGSTIELKSVKELVDFSCPSCSSEYPCHNLRK